MNIAAQVVADADGTDASSTRAWTRLGWLGCGLMALALSGCYPSAGQQDTYPLLKDQNPRTARAQALSEIPSRISSRYAVHSLLR